MHLRSVPRSEAGRVAALEGYGLLDTAPEASFDAVVSLASAICDTPIALVSLLDATRQWFKANVGLAHVTETPRAISFCAHAVASHEYVEVGDTHLDLRFADNPLVTGEENFRFYAGVPLVDRHGHALGTLCTIDRRPRTLTDRQREGLQSLAEALVALIETRKDVPNEILRHLSVLSAALEHSSDPSAVLNVVPGGATSFAYVNPAFCELFGYDSADLVDAPPSLLMGPATDPGKIARLRAAVAEGASGTENLFLYTSSGAKRLIEVRDRAIDARHRVVSARDLTRAHEMQQALVRTNQRLHALHEISTARENTTAAQIEAALTLALEAFDMQFGYVGEIDGDFIRMLHVVGDPVAARGSVTDLKKTYLYDMLATGDVGAIGDLATTRPDREGMPTYEDWHGYISAPITVEGRIFGALGFLSRKVVSFDQSDLDFVRLVATLISTLLERERYVSKLDRLAYYDGLTELANRAHFLRSVETALRDEKRTNEAFAIHFIDLDGFKTVNDRFGHAEGDRVLQETAKRLRTVAYGVGFLVARLGGDEFVVLQSRLAHGNEAEELGRRVVAALAVPFVIDGVEVALGGSVGIAIHPHHGADVRTLLTHADEALYRAKAKGKNRLEFR